MRKIGRLMYNKDPKEQPNSVIVNGDTPIREALLKMKQQGCNCISVAAEGDTLGDSAQEEILGSVLTELDRAGAELEKLQQQTEAQPALTEEGIRSLVESEQNRLEVVIESMTEGVIVVDESGQIKIANRAAKVLLALPPESCLLEVKTSIEGLGLKGLVIGTDVQAKKKAGEFMAKAAEGKILQVKWSAMISQSNNFLGNVIIIRDVTAAIELDRAKTEFIAGISHELRTPLTTIQNAISNISAGVTGRISKKTREYLHTIDGDCQRLNMLINDLLDAAKLEVGRMPVSRRVTNLVNLVSKVVGANMDWAAEKDLRLGCDVCGHISPVYVDPQRIYQVLTNLINNAMKYTERGGKITLRLYDNSDEVTTVVEDNGIGIPAEKQSYIFNKFYQISRPSGPGYNGSGLGLSLSKEIVEIHGGKMWVESKEGQGSKFYFSLPKTDPRIILNKHLAGLAGRTTKTGEQFVTMVIKFGIGRDDKAKYKSTVDAMIKGILAAGSNIVSMSDDLVIHSAESEVVFVLSQTGKRYLKSIRRQIRGIIETCLKNNGWKRWRKDEMTEKLLPMLGIAFYPNDCSDVRELAEIARGRTNKLF